MIGRICRLPKKTCSDMYLLDTNIASDAIKGIPFTVRERLLGLPMRSAAVSAVTQGELMHGLAKLDYPARLTALVHEFLIRVEVLPWTADVATAYGSLRASCAARGVTLGALDMMIAAQAVAADSVLVTRDKAFSRVGSRLRIQDWT
jgi:tRNA(fMet)-specific endonuclease VapC